VLTTRNISKRNLIIAYAIWWLGYTLIQSLVLSYTFNLSTTLALYDSLITNAIVGASAYAIVNIIRFYQPGQMLRLGYSLGLSVIGTFIFHLLVEELFEDNFSYISFADQSLFIRCFFIWIMISLFSASAALWYYMRDQQDIDNRKVLSEKLARQAELQTLRQQLQPHFLFNSLNSISALALINPEEARKMIQQLSDFLRGTLKKDDQQLIPFTEEIAHLQLYLDIEKVRFGHRLKTQITLQGDVQDLKLPSLLLQPIVENAIKFGLYDTIGEITITINAFAEHGYLIVSVRNPYDPATAKPREGTGFGLNAIQRRLYLLFARHDLLSTSQEATTFTTTVKIPQTS
jgi:two-component system, LytTR family, sensor kinase